MDNCLRSESADRRSGQYLHTEHFSLHAQGWQQPASQGPPVTGAPYNTISVKQADANTLTFTQKMKDGKYSVTGRSVISEDGKTMTSTMEGTSADGKAYSATMVWDKQ